MTSYHVILNLIQDLPSGTRGCRIESGMTSYHVILNLIQDLPSGTRGCRIESGMAWRGPTIRKPWMPDRVRHDVARTHIRNPWMPDRVRHDVLSRHPELDSGPTSGTRGCRIESGMTWCGPSCPGLLLCFGNGNILSGFADPQP